LLIIKSQELEKMIAKDVNKVINVISKQLQLKILMDKNVAKDIFEYKVQDLIFYRNKDVHLELMDNFSYKQIIFHEHHDYKIIIVQFKEFQKLIFCQLIYVQTVNIETNHLLFLELDLGVFIEI